mgnify:CR=1 FL=1
MNENLIKRLAKTTVRNGQINMRAAKYALSSLTRKELIVYLATIKRVVYENSVRVISPEALPIKIQQSIESKFKGRVIFFEQDKSLDSGIKIVIDDTIIDLTVNGYITSALEQLKR